MSAYDKVVWTQGMFLQPQHFQQETRHLEHLLQARAQALQVHGWGFTELVLDEGLLAQGRVGLLRASGVLPDGTPFSMPDLLPLPPALEVPADLKDEVIHLAAPLQRVAATDFEFSADGSGGPARYAVAEESLRDLTDAAEDPVTVQVGRLRLRLVRRRDLTDGESGLGLARVLERRADRQLLLDRNYIAPQLRIDASRQLSDQVGKLVASMDSYAKALSTRMGDARQGVSEIADFLMLMALNRHQPVLREFGLGPHIHPQTLHQACLMLAGELSSFGSESGQRTPQAFPAYRHDDLQGCFGPLLQAIATQLAQVPVPRATSVELTDRQHGFRTAVVRDAELLRNGSFVLAVHAQLPAEQLCQRFLAQAKLGPVERIREIVSLALPGIALRNLPVAPRQLPYHAGYHYFEADRSGELWKQFERSGNLALHVAGDFPGLELELWAIRP